MSDFVGPMQSFPSGSTTAINPADTTQTLKILPLGTMAISRDGRKFRFALNGALADLVPGNIVQSAPLIPANQGLAVQAPANPGDFAIAVTLGAAAVTANQYAGGFVLIASGPGQGFTYRIKSHPAAASTTTLLLTLEADDPVLVGPTTGSTASLVASPYNGVIQTPTTTLTGAVVGGVNSVIPAGYYGWIQTAGMFNALISGTPAVGQALSCPAAIAGALAINSGTLPVVATAMVVGVDSTNKPVFLCID